MKVRIQAVTEAKGDVTSQEVERVINSIFSVGEPMSRRFMEEIALKEEQRRGKNIPQECLIWIEFDIENLNVKDGFQRKVYSFETSSPIKLITVVKIHDDCGLVGDCPLPPMMIDPDLNCEFSDLNRGELLLKNQGLKTVVEISDILFIEKEEKKCVIHMRCGEVLETVSSLTELENSLDNPELFRTHKSYLVSLKDVKNVEKDPYMKSYNIILKNSCKIIKLSKYRYREFVEALERHVKV